MSDKTPFQRVVDDLTGGCGCGCHTGIGYNAACRHCQPQFYPPERSAGAAPLDASAEYVAGFRAGRDAEAERSARSAGAAPLDALHSALERTLNNFRASLAGKPIRDATETIAEAEAALAHQRSAGAAPINVEALAEAIESHVRHRLSFHDATSCDGDCAADILARLSEGTDR